MKAGLFLATGAALLLALPASATSFQQVEHDCPVCAFRSVTANLASYSNFSEPARDLSDSPNFAFDSVELCPADLFATWKSRWKPLKPAEKSRLVDFLKTPFITLTAEERAIVKGHEADLPETPWWNLWWARSCDARRDPDPRQQCFVTMDLHFTGRRVLHEDWQLKLAAHYRDQAIGALEAAAGSEWSSKMEKRIFPYLRAELIRQAGRTAEAKDLFAAVIASEKKLPKNEETAWIAAWASQQSLLIDVAQTPTTDLSTWLSPDMPDPWRNEGEPPGWNKHRAGLIELLTRARSGDATAAEILWKALDRKPARLLAVAETFDDGALGLRELGGQWEKWFAEIEAILKRGKLPNFGREEPNDVRVNNVLRPAITIDRKSEQWRQKVFTPAIARALEKGGLLDAGLSGEPLLQQLRTSFENAPPAQRLDYARLIFRALKASSESRDVGYELVFMADDLAALKDPQGLLRTELEGKWESGYWKAVCSYVAAVPGSEASLLKHPRLLAEESPDEGPPYHSIVWYLLTERRSPAWKFRALNQIANARYLDSKVLNYAVALEDKDLTEALKQRAARLRKTDPKDEQAESRLGQADDIEKAFASQRILKIPLR